MRETITMILYTIAVIIITLAFALEPKNSAYKVEQQRVEFIYEIIVAQRDDKGCPCAHEVWSTVVRDGVSMEDWYMIYQENNCWD